MQCVFKSGNWYQYRTIDFPMYSGDFVANDFMLSITSMARDPILIKRVQKKEIALLSRMKSGLLALHWHWPCMDYHRFGLLWQGFPEMLKIHFVKK